jgi:hypothetical protein
MKTPFPAFLIVALAAFAPAAQAAATVSFYGYQIDVPEWRSTSVTKTITTGGGPVAAPNSVYGLDGYQYVAGQSLPTYISGTAFTGSYNLFAYEPIDDPTLAIGPTVANMASSLLYAIPGAGVEFATPQFTFTVGSTPPASFLVGIAFGNFPLADSAYLGYSYRVTIGASNSGPVALLGNNGLIDWIFFKVDGATLGDEIKIYGTGGANGFADLAAVSFDTIPEPGSPLMLGLGAAALACGYRRRR